MEGILGHLEMCLKYGMAPKAFLEKFIVDRPVMQVGEERKNVWNCQKANNFLLYPQNDREHRPVQSWSLICDSLLSRYGVLCHCKFQKMSPFVSRFPSGPSSLAPSSSSVRAISPFSARSATSPTSTLPRRSSTKHQTSSCSGETRRRQFEERNYISQRAKD